MEKIPRRGKGAKMFFQLPHGAWCVDDNWEIPPSFSGVELTEIPDGAFAFWLHDMKWRPAAYIGHRVRVKGVFIRIPESDDLIFGRQVIKQQSPGVVFEGILVMLQETQGVKAHVWQLVTADIYPPDAAGGDPILRVTDCQETHAPRQEFQDCDGALYLVTVGK